MSDREAMKGREGDERKEERAEGMTKEGEKFDSFHYDLNLLDATADSWDNFPTLKSSHLTIIKR